MKNAPMYPFSKIHFKHNRDDVKSNQERDNGPPVGKIHLAQEKQENMSHQGNLSLKSQSKKSHERTKSFATEIAKRDRDKGLVLEENIARKL